MIPKNFKKLKLKNGITLIHEHRDLPVVSVSITNPHFGGAYETSEIKGVAHFIEHLLFTGTKSRTHEDISREIEKKGGVLNAFTNHQVTSYWFKLPSEHVISGLTILADMLNNPSFNPEKFEKEKKVIIEEIKMYHDNPMYAVYENIEKKMFHPPFNQLIIGSKESVSSLKRDFVFDLFKSSYNPKNFIVTVVGNADISKISEFLEKNFKPNNSKTSLIQIKKSNGEHTEERENLDQAHFLFAMHAPLPGTKEFLALEVLDGYIANGMSSRLFLEIREKRGLAYSVRSSVSAEKDYSVYSIYSGTTKEAYHQVKELIIKEFKNIDSMTEKDLKEAKERIIGLKRVTAEESSNVINDLMYSELVDKSEDYYNYEEKISSVSLEEVKSLSKSLIKSYSTAAIIPKG